MSATSTSRMAGRRGCLQMTATGLLAGWGALARPAMASGQARLEGPRLVSLGGGMTEVLYALGADTHVVGVDTTSLYPEAALHTPKVGYMRQLSAEGVLSLRPTAVLGTHEAGPAAVLAQLRQAGVDLHLVRADHSFEELRRKVRAAAQASGRARQGRELESALQARWTQVLDRIGRGGRAHGKAPAAKGPRVLFVMSHAGRAQGAGVGTAAHAVLEMVGAQNVFASLGGYRPLSAEAVAQASPQVLVTTRESVEGAGGIDRFWGHPGLAYTPAARHGRLVVVDTMALLGFGPRLPDALERLHEALG